MREREKAWEKKGEERQRVKENGKRRRWSRSKTFTVNRISAGI